MAKDPSKTEDATPKQIQKARDEGNVPKSQELTKAVTACVAVIFLSAYAGTMGEHIREVYTFFLSNGANFIVDQQNIYALMVYTAKTLAMMLLPILFAIALSAWICLRLQVGPLWTTKPMEFKWSRFNILTGLKNMFASAQTFIRLGRSVLQALLIGAIPFLVIRSEFDNFLPLYYSTVTEITFFILDLAFWIMLYSLPPMFIIGAVELWYNRYEFKENLKMTKSEVKDESKQSEGDPMIKSKQREAMMKVMVRRMLQDVPKADVVITNPTHIAVALSYNALEAPAPMVLAMGVDHMAERIKAVAREHNVPIRENVPLARALYKSVDVGDMIPEELYKAVAAILAGIWRIKGRKMH